MRRFIAAGVGLALAVVAVSVATAHDDSNRNAFTARLDSYHELPAISSIGTGSLVLKVDPTGTSIAYTLTYANLQGGAATGAHIHLAQSGVNGAVVVFLCGGGGKPACPASGSVTGTITSADVIGVP